MLVDEELGWFLKSKLGVIVTSGANARHNNITGIMFLQTAIFFLCHPYNNVIQNILP